MVFQCRVNGVLMVLQRLVLQTALKGATTIATVKGAITTATVKGATTTATVKEATTTATVIVAPFPSTLNVSCIHDIYIYMYCIRLCLANGELRES